jgi:hypothetical protein
MNEKTHSWGLGGDFRSPYAPYQDRETEIFAFNAGYFLDVLNGIDLEFRYKFIDDENNRVKSEAGLADAYGDGYEGASIDRSTWVFDFESQFRGCTGCDDRDAEYAQYGISIGYQLHPDLYATLLYDYWEVDLVDGTVDVAQPVESVTGNGFEFSNNFGFLEYLTGDHTKNRIGVMLNYFLSGVEFGASADWFWGDYDPEFYTNDNGRRAKLIPTADAVPTPLGDIATEQVDLEQYRLKAFMKVSF